MEIFQTNQFEKLVKKLPAKHKESLDDAIKAILKDPQIGEGKVGDLSGVWVYKFRLNNALTLLAYTADETSITLLSFGPHENFYRDLKRTLH
jgi:mRNA-degrading endonuclease RelE of RelBE toxin-antitoxin system